MPGHWGRAGARSPLRPLGSLSDALEATLPPLDGEDEMQNTLVRWGFCFFTVLVLLLLKVICPPGDV